MVNTLNYKENNEKKSSIKSFLSAIALASLLAQGDISANEVKTLEQELKTASRNTYPAFINVYGVGKRYEGNSYSGVGIKVYNKTLEATFESGPDFQKASIIGVKKSGNTYIKGGIGYLHLEDYKVLKYTINPTQISGGIALGYNQGNNFNIEAGYIAHKLEGAAKANTTAYTKYLELIYRGQTQIGQFDFTGIVKQEEAYGEKDNYVNGSVAYYPTKNIKIGSSYNNLGRYTDGNYNIMAGIKYTFGGGKKGKWSPFISGTYYNSSKVATTFSYEENIANRPLYWKDEFEAAINTKQLVAEKVAPEEFKKRIKESFNKVPFISVSASATTITEGESVTLTANVSDSDGSVTSIVWYDSNGNQIGTGNSITITPDSTGTFSYYAIATDDDGASKQSNTITIEVQASYNAYWQKPLQSEVNNVGAAPGEISDASGKQVVINDLTSYVANLPEGSTFKIVSAVTNDGDPTRMSGFSIEGNSLIRDGPDTGGSKTYGTLTIQIVYPDGSAGPTATLDVEIGNS